MNKSAFQAAVGQYGKGFLSGALQASNGGGASPADAGGAEAEFYSEGREDGLSGVRAAVAERPQRFVPKDDAERTGLLAALRKGVASCSEAVPVPAVYNKICTEGAIYQAEAEQRVNARAVIAQISSNPTLAKELVATLQAAARDADANPPQVG